VREGKDAQGAPYIERDMEQCVVGFIVMLFFFFIIIFFFYLIAYIMSHYLKILNDTAIYL